MNNYRRPAKRRLVIVNQWAGYLFVDIANQAAEKYQHVALIAGRVSELNRGLGSDMRRSWMPPYWRRNLISRMFSWVAGFLWVVALLRLRYRNYEVLLSTNPPLATWVPLFVPNPCSLYVLDLYPEALSMTGMAKESGFIFRAWKRLNQKAYGRFRRIFVLTEGMRKALKPYGVSSVAVVPPWSAGIGEQVLDERLADDILREYGLEDRFLVLYSGNLGKEHEIEALLSAAEALSADKSIQFIIAGGGWKHEEISKKVRRVGLKNVLMLPFQEPGRFTALMSAAHVGVVAQSTKTASVCIPSKTFNLLSAGMPIVAIGSKDSDLADLLSRYGCGQTFAANDGRALATHLQTLAQNPDELARLGHSAKRAARDFTEANSATLVEAVFCSND